jgi:hypothetical protein
MGEQLAGIELLDADAAAAIGKQVHVFLLELVAWVDVQRSFSRIRAFTPVFDGLLRESSLFAKCRRSQTSKRTLRRELGPAFAGTTGERVARL